MSEKKFKTGDVVGKANPVILDVFRGERLLLEGAADLIKSVQYKRIELWRTLAEDLGLDQTKYTYILNYETGEVQVVTRYNGRGRYNFETGEETDSTDD